MTDLGTLGGSFSTALDLNDRGQVVGTSGSRGFVWTAAEGMVELPPLPGYAFSEALFVNNNGYVVGRSLRDAGGAIGLCGNLECRATLWVVPVDDAQQLISDTINLIASYNLKKLGTSLPDKLQIASNFAAAGQVSEACGTLMGFLNQVSAQKGKALTVDQATELTARVIQIRNVLGC